MNVQVCQFIKKGIQITMRIMQAMGELGKSNEVMIGLSLRCDFVIAL